MSIKLNKNLNNYLDLTYYNPIVINIASYVTDSENNSILIYAIRDNNYNLCKFLLENGFNPNIKYCKFPKYPILNEAIKYNNYKIIKLILKYIIDINELDYKMESPLCRSCENGNYNISKLLLKLGAYINGYYANYNKKLNYTPLYYAVKSNNIKLVEYLLKKNANPNIWSDGAYGNPSYLPLHIAIENNNYKMCKLLLLYGALPEEDNDVQYGNYWYRNNPSPYDIILKTNNIKLLNLFKYYM